MTIADIYGTVPLEGSRSVQRPVVHTAIRYTFCLFVFSLLFEMTGVQGPVKLTSAAGALFMASTLLQPRLCYRQPPAVVWCFAAWTGVCAVMAVWVGPANLDDVSHEFFVLVQSVVLCWVSYGVMLDGKVARAAMGSLVASCVLLGVLQLTGITATVVDAGTAQERVSALGQNPSDIAMICSIALLWSAGVVFGSKVPNVRSRLAGMAVVALLGLTVLRTEARGAIIALGAGILVFLFQPSALRVRMRNVMLIVLAAATFVVVGMQSKSMVDRFKEAETGKMAGRERIYPLAMGLVRERPIFGWGFVSNLYELGSRVHHVGMPRRDTHNLILFLLTASGFVGASPALLGLWFTVSDSWKARYGEYGIVPFSIVVTVLVGNLSVTWYSKLFWIVLGFASAAWATSRYTRTPTRLDRLRVL